MNAVTSTILETMPPLLELKGVTKHYGAVTALSEGNLVCRSHTIHAIMGENGAGKSTLIKIIAGVVSPSDGQIFLDGKPISFTGPTDAQKHGCVCVFQELSLVPDLTVAENIVMISPPRKFGLIDAKAQRREAEKFLALVGCEDIDTRARVKDLPLSRRQMIEIAKALSFKPRLLILDEATSALTAEDVGKVYALLRRLREEGTCILYISHRMHEIRELADVCSVFANGRHIQTFRHGEHTEGEIVKMMIGREISHLFPSKPWRNFEDDKPALEARNLIWEPRLRNVSASVMPGEIFGLGGLDGQGQREFLLALFGCLVGVSGEILVDGMPTYFRSPANAKKQPNALALIPEDRKSEGLMLKMSVAENLTAATLMQCRNGLFVSRTKEREAVENIVRRMQIKAIPDLPVETLSGGNQQKVVIGKWLLANPNILLLNDPTRGIDIGTKQEIYRLLRELADTGTTIVFYSTDYDELIGLCDRVAIFYAGQIIRTLKDGDITEEAIVANALNVTQAEEAQAL
ncbi:sugar ABC transporter ATP-binding protein [Kozakia baliensis]|uniref:sugar ABC transporter ATP-binding protein n=1 Tax=Kozakia baliensis TaxID=153496 RepID=UPI000A60BC9D|nr:sugar ABC transporter ATP-binding protein [Kozakia baliensis]